MLGVRKWPFSTRISTDGQLFDPRLPKVLESDVQTNGSRNQKYILMENQTLYSNARKVSVMGISVTNHTNFWFQWFFCWLLWFCNKISKLVMVSLILKNKLNVFIRQEIGFHKHSIFNSRKKYQEKSAKLALLIRTVALAPNFKDFRILRLRI